MSKLTRFVLAFLALLWTAQIGDAVPRPPPYAVRSLLKRDNVVFQDCGGDGATNRIKAGKAWSEAANLASFTIDGTLDSGTKFQGTNA